MHRHLHALGGRVQISVLHTEQDGPDLPGHYRLPPRRFYERLLHSRLNEQARRIENTWGLFYPRRVIAAVMREVRPDAVLTVAEGSLHLAVAAVTRRRRLPLVTVFHDWAPGWPEVPPAARASADTAFRAVHRGSVASLPVCPELLEHLGAHPYAPVLYPIPDGATLLDQGDTAPEFHVLYAGVFYAMYAAEMKALCRELERTQSGGLLRVLGPDPQWQGDDADRLQRLGVHAGFFKGEEFRRRLAAAPAHLVISSFDPGFELYSRYSFPSKIPEYCRYGRPIVIWGPTYAASVRWALRTGAACVVSDPNPAALLAVLRQLAQQPELRSELGRRAAQAAATDFAPARLQGIFESGLRQALPNLDPA